MGFVHRLLLLLRTKICVFYSEHKHRIGESQFVDLHRRGHRKLLKAGGSWLERTWPLALTPQEKNVAHRPKTHKNQNSAVQKMVEENSMKLLEGLLQPV